jgi:O-antigen ligase
MFFKNWIQKYNLTEILLLVLVLFIPLEKTTMRILVVLITATALVKGKYNIFKTNIFWIKLILPLLWILPFAQLIALNGLSDHWTQLETKLSLLLLPIVFLIGVKINKDFINELAKIFIVGCCISIIICLIKASYNSYILEIENSFYYKNLSVFHHPSYYTMYINFGVGLLYLNLISRTPLFNIQNKLQWLMIITFTLFIVLVSSRTGWISNFIIHSTFIIILIRRKFFKQKHIFYGISVLIIVGGLINFSPSLKNRFNEIIDHTLYANQQSDYPSSTSTRIKAWESAAVLIKDHWIFGLGTGTGAIELNKIYNSKKYFSLKEKNTNTHNQYLQFLLDHGIIGLIFLLFFTLIMFIKSYRSKQFMYTLFIGLIIINFMTESVLETQSGVIFFAFFNTLFFFNWINNKYVIVD